MFYCYSMTKIIILSIIVLQLKTDLLSGSWSRGNNTFTTPSNCSYIKLNLGNQYGTTYNHDITISLYYETGDGYDQYYPYEEPKVYDTGTEVLRKAGSAKDYKTPDSVVHRLVGTYTITGNESWLVIPVNNNESCRALGKFTIQNISDYLVNAKRCPNVSSSINYNVRFSNFISIANAFATSSSDMGSGNASFYESYLFFQSDAFKDKTNNEVKALLTGTVIYYELAEETTEQGTPFSENIEINDYGTMGWKDTNDAYVEVPQGCKIFYPADYALFIDSLGQREDINWDPLAIISATQLTAFFTQISGYDATKTQTLKNVNGTLTWVDDE